MFGGRILLGADPEVPVWDIKKGRYVAPTNRLGGNKMMPHKVDGIGAYQEDGAAAEYNVIPSGSVESFSMNHTAIKNELLSKLKGENLVPHIRESVVYCDEELQDPEINIVGCDIDYNAYDHDANTKPSVEGLKFRSFGGHIHIGVNASPQDKTFMVKALDATVGLFEVATVPFSQRRKLYGKAGDYRVKSYGFEYRTPSNFWTINANMTKRIAYNAIRAIRNHQTITRSYIDPEEVRHIINSHDRAAAKKMYNGLSTRIGLKDLLSEPYTNKLFRNFSVEAQ